ncbi:substrate-binding domain-containing protein [Solirubrobacter sp. CPCC 204708]|uniref:Substrate-binding domain-containing protein n=1 Tax=Solirubrobacter deserti TaxID=2282478 RepID=A0ABT4RS29_9ACTN|nr:substrate-binding domain-containing protein [Solirubrobacter deserti]MBE2317566.1 substrate-binding domain-containing protein [Solirubrobacter deserti]MDA0141260.1 substrate-binding domain-containing protein [Solirubrobacter deserti]
MGGLSGASGAAPSPGPARGRGAALKRARRLLGAATVASLLLTPSPAPGAARTITMSGASPAQAVVADLAYFYRRERADAPRFSLVGGGTGIGIADAARGIVDAGLSGRGLEPGDPPGLTFTPLARSAICLVTNPANRVPNLTRAQLQPLVSGATTSWAQIAGAPRRDAIERVTFDVTSAARNVFLTTFVDLATPLAPATTYTASAQVRDHIAATPAAFGYVDLEFARRLHAVPYEGVPCTRATVADGSYPARRTLGFVTRGRPAGALARFLAWIRTDATARRVIASRYVVP